MINSFDGGSKRGGGTRQPFHRHSFGLIGAAAPPDAEIPWLFHLAIAVASSATGKTVAPARPPLLSSRLIEQSQMQTKAPPVDRQHG
jgi:hypothetical protein